MRAGDPAAGLPGENNLVIKALILQSRCNFFSLFITYLQLVSSCYRLVVSRWLKTVFKVLPHIFPLLFYFHGIFLLYYYLLQMSWQNFDLFLRIFLSLFSTPFIVGGKYSVEVHFTFFPHSEIVQNQGECKPLHPGHDSYRAYAGYIVYSTVLRKSHADDQKILKHFSNNKVAVSCMMVLMVLNSMLSGTLCGSFFHLGAFSKP